MAVNWGLAGTEGPNILQSLQLIGQQQLQQQALQQRQYAFEQARRQDASRLDLAGRVRSGDLNGARREALISGDTSFAAGLNQLADDDLAQTQIGLDAIGALSEQLRSVPVEQRANVAAPILARAGVPAESVSGFDWTDSSLAGVYTLSKQGQAALKARMEAAADAAKPRVVGTDLVSGNGVLLYRGQKEPDYQFDSESGSWLLKPGTGSAGYSGGAPAPQGGGSLPQGYNGSPATSGRTQYGWTPRSRNGGDNDDAAVDGKIAGMSRALRLAPGATFPEGMSDIQIARALTLSEGGAGSIADRNNNPGNLRDPKTGAYRRFATKEDGLQAAAAQVRRNRARGQNTISAMVEGLPVGGQPRGNAPNGDRPGVINVRPPKSRDDEGYHLLTDDEKRARGLDVNTQYQASPKGQITALGSKAASLTEAQSKAVGYLERAVAASNSLNDISGYNPTTLAQNLDKLGTTNPFRTGLSQTDRRALSGIRAFVLAVLRQDSGAAINKDEFDQMAQTLFPLPGDGPEVQADKRRQREAAIRGLRTASGPGASTVSRTKANPSDRNGQGARASGAWRTGEVRQIGGFKVKALD